MIMMGLLSTSACTTVPASTHHTIAAAWDLGKRKEEEEEEEEEEHPEEHPGSHRGRPALSGNCGAQRAGSLQSPLERGRVHTPGAGREAGTQTGPGREASGE